jgi:hypothetical protein
MIKRSEQAAATTKRYRSQAGIGTGLSRPFPRFRAFVSEPGRRDLHVDRLGRPGPLVAIAELQTSKRTGVKLAASALLLPHWGALARCAAGLVCLALAAWQNGLGPASVALLPLLLALAWLVLAISAVLARAGVARPDLDVIQFVVRWGRREKELPPISIGASVFQFFLSISTIPVAKLLSPSVLYRPELGPSLTTLLLTLALSAVLVVLVYLLWFSRIEWVAAPEQQREAEKHA